MLNTYLQMRETVLAAVLQPVQYLEVSQIQQPDKMHISWAAKVSTIWEQGKKTKQEKNNLLT